MTGADGAAGASGVGGAAEAAAAQAFWQACRYAAGQFLAGCGSGLELAAAGYTAGVVIAAEHDTQDTVPLLTGPAFTASAEPTRGESGA